MSTLEELEAALTKAEASLGIAVANATKADADPDDAHVNIEKARAYCRAAHAALIMAMQSEPTV